ncbi:hypothetical protein [Pantoea sp. BAV 3049]|nr:hypothetical protein [Pantoea sp. BAV 3049]
MKFSSKRHDEQQDQHGRRADAGIENMVASEVPPEYVFHDWEGGD